MKTETAIFIDGNWLYMVTRQINKNIDFVKFFNALIKKFGNKAKIYFFGTIDSTNRQQIKFYLLLRRVGYIVYNTEVKKMDDRTILGSLDIDLTVDAMKILPSLKNFVLISGDSDFAALLEWANQIGVKTSVIALPFSLGYSLRKVANTFINLETLIIEHKSAAYNNIEKFKNENYIKKGDFFKPYIKLRNLLKLARNKVIIIDQYIDDQILLMIQLLKIGINIIIITDTKKVTPVDFFVQLEKIKKDGHLIDIIDSKKFHDRFICIDNNWWHSGCSLKDLGKKDSMLNKVTQKNAKEINNEVIKLIDNSEI